MSGGSRSATTASARSPPRLRNATWQENNPSRCQRMKKQRGLFSQKVSIAALTIVLAGSWSISDSYALEGWIAAADDERIDPASLRITPREPAEALKSFKTV